MTAVAAALADAGDRVVCFGADGRERRSDELVSAASGLAERMRASGGRRWALNLDDGFDFAAALLGCWAAGKTPVIAPRPLLAALEPGAFDGVVESAHDSTAAVARVEWQSVEPSRRALAPIGPQAAFVLYTSGSTGVPKEVGRRLANVESELAVLESVFGAKLGEARVYATVSHRHVYGLLFRVLWPLVSRRAFAAFDCEYPEQLLGAIGRANVLVSSPAMLKRIGHLPAGAGQWRAVFSSGGALPPPAIADVGRVLGVAAIEVYGSTETSGIAWRTAPAAGFRLLPSVEVRALAESLDVRSPFSGSDAWLAMADRVLVREDGTLELLGRADRIAKIEDKRVSLSEIERRLLEHEYVKDVVAVAIEDERRQYVGAVVELSDVGRAALQARGVRALNVALRRALRGRVDAVAVPRAFRYPAMIPVDPQGKRSVAALRDLFERRP